MDRNTGTFILRGLFGSCKYGQLAGARIFHAWRWLHSVLGVAHGLYLQTVCKCSAYPASFMTLATHVQAQTISSRWVGRVHACVDHTYLSTVIYRWSAKPGHMAEICKCANDVPPMLPGDESRTPSCVQPSVPPSYTLSLQPRSMPMTCLHISPTHPRGANFLKVNHPHSPNIKITHL